jgi:hypothetical protein
MLLWLILLLLLQDCVWSGDDCLPRVIGLHYIPPPPDQ